MSIMTSAAIVQMHKAASEKSVWLASMTAMTPGAGMGNLSGACLLRGGIQVIRLSSGRLKGERNRSDINHFKLTPLACHANSGV